MFLPILLPCKHSSIARIHASIRELSVTILESFRLLLTVLNVHSICTFLPPFSYNTVAATHIADSDKIVILKMRNIIVSPKYKSDVCGMGNFT